MSMLTLAAFRLVWCKFVLFLSVSRFSENKSRMAFPNSIWSISFRPNSDSLIGEQREKNKHFSIVCDSTHLSTGAFIWTLCISNISIKLNWFRFDRRFPLNRQVSVLALPIFFSNSPNQNLIRSQNGAFVLRTFFRCLQLIWQLCCWVCCG